jgi:hypothetical protein
VKEIVLKDNMTDLRIFINGVPNLKLIPKDESEVVVSALEEQISEFYKKERGITGKTEKGVSPESDNNS